MQTYLQMKHTAFFFSIVATAALLAGCGSSSNGGPPTKADVQAFKGNPKSTALQKALQAHFGGQSAPTPPPAPAGQ
jgi:hypothetical protein